MAGYDLEKQVTGRWGSCIAEGGCISAAAMTSAGSFGATNAIPTRLSRLLLGVAWSDTTAECAGHATSICAGGWLDFTFSDGTITHFRYLALGY